jgi:pimeloyl-ACP methyl ester carboxylesterase
MNGPEPLSFTVFGKHFAARCWHQGAPIKMLALHGWLDNSASFDLLAPQLHGVEVVALDLAGHGQTDFRSEDAAYNVFSDLSEIHQILNQLGWQQVVLLGHSRGASIATLYGSAFPKQVSQLVLLDNFLPAPVAAEHFPDQLANSVTDKIRLLNRKCRYYQSFEEACQAREQGELALPEGAASLLASQGVVETAKGYHWRADPRLHGASEVKLSQQHIRAVVDSLVMPVLILLGQKSSLIPREALAQLVSTNPNIAIEEMPGGHHFHMEATVDQVALRVGQFLI